jgi:hypothetical protein
MAVDPKVTLPHADMARRVALVFTDSAQDDLANAISAIHLMVESDRHAFWEDVVAEYGASIVRKLQLAASVACVRAKSMPESAYAEPGDSGQVTP